MRKHSYYEYTYGPYGVPSKESLGGDMRALNTALLVKKSRKVKCTFTKFDTEGAIVQCDTLTSHTTCKRHQCEETGKTGRCKLPVIDQNGDRYTKCIYHWDPPTEKETN